MTRDDFIDLVYEELSEDSDNCRANRIIDAADEYAYPKDEGLNHVRFVTKISQLSSKNGWLTCNDTMPPDGEYILIFDGRKVLQAIYYKSINGYWISGDLFIEGKDIIYWMPFPDPPIKEAQNES